MMQTTSEANPELFKTFLQFYVYDLRFKATGLTTFFIEFWTLDNGLALNRWQGIIETNDGVIYWCIYVSLSLSELNDWVISLQIGFVDLKCVHLKNLHLRYNKCA